MRQLYLKIQTYKDYCARTDYTLLQQIPLNWKNSNSPTYPFLHYLIFLLFPPLDSINFQSYRVLIFFFFL